MIYCSIKSASFCLLLDNRSVKWDTGFASCIAKRARRAAVSDWGIPHPSIRPMACPVRGAKRARRAAVVLGDKPDLLPPHAMPQRVEYRVGAWRRAVSNLGIPHPSIRPMACPVRGAKRARHAPTCYPPRCMILLHYRVTMGKKTWIASGCAVSSTMTVSVATSETLPAASR